MSEKSKFIPRFIGTGAAVLKRSAPNWPRLGARPHENGFARQARKVSPARRERFRLPGEKGFACQASELLRRRSPSATLRFAARLRRRYGSPLAFGDVTSGCPLRG